MESIDWVIYTRSEPVCPWCEKLKIVFKSRGIPFEERDYKTLWEHEWQIPLAGTVPQAYYQGILIGGYERTKEYLNV